MNGQVSIAMTAVRRVVVSVLSCVSLGVTAAGLPPGSPLPATSAASVREAPVGRLIIRYRHSIQLAGQGKATAASERVDAAAVVDRSARLAGAGGLHFLKSVSARMHVASLDQSVTPAQAQALMQRLRADPAVEEVLIDERAQPHLVPNDPLFTSTGQWHLQAGSVVTGAINAAGAWDFSRGTGTVVAVLDGGYRPHADLLANILPGYDFISADNAMDYGGNAHWTANDGTARDADARDPGDWVTPAEVSAGYCSHAADSSWHGTHVAGLVAAAGNNSAGGLGVAFGAQVLPVRVLGRCGGYTSDILAGARWAAGLVVPGVPVNTSPARVLNLSLGVDGACDSAWQEVVNEVLARNISIVASTGNSSSTSITKPASCSGVVAVTAHDRYGRHATYANVGKSVAISAPGGDSDGPVLSTWNTGWQRPGGDTYGDMAGTSMAAPEVSGVLALLSALRPELSMSTLEGFVRSSARPFPVFDYCQRVPAGYCGAGLLDAAAAVEAARPATADLMVTQDLLSGPPVSGDLSRYVITVRNVGLQTATQVQLSASVSSNMSIESVDAGPAGAGTVFSSGGLTASQDSLAPGQTMVLTVAARVAAGTGLSSTAQASASAVEANTANNSDVLLLAGPALPVLEPESFADGSASGDGGGGGCTVAPAGQADIGLPLLAAVAALVLLWRRFRPG